MEDVVFPSFIFVSLSTIFRVNYTPSHQLRLNRRFAWYFQICSPFPQQHRCLYVSGLCLDPKVGALRDINNI